MTCFSLCWVEKQFKNYYGSIFCEEKMYSTKNKK